MTELSLLDMIAALSRIETRDDTPTMQIDVKEAARLLGVSEKTIYRWIKQGDLPTYRINDLYRFNRAELLEWATARRVGVSPDIFDDSGSASDALPGLEEAIKAGGIHYRVAGTAKEEVLAAIVDLMHLPEEVDRKFLLSVILARESLGSTGFGGGIAIPHVRNPIVLHIQKPMITLCFLETPVEFGAIDRKAGAHPVHDGEPDGQGAPPPALPAHLRPSARRVPRTGD